MKSRIDSVNRFLLFLLGLIALAGGVVILLLSVRVFGDSQADQPVLRQATRDFADRNPWLWIAIGVGAAILALLALRWLFAQASTQRVSAMNLEPDRSAGHTRLSPNALGEAVEDEIERIRGVDGASARVLGSSKSPTLRVDVKVADDGDLGYIRSRLEQDAVPNARQAVGFDRLPVWVRLNVATEQHRSLN
jgi:hypothetical protein